MIQRRQTIYMFLTAALSALLFIMPLALFHDGDTIMKMTIFGIENPVESLDLSVPEPWPLVLLAALMTIIPFYTMFRFKKREKQLKLCNFTILLNIVFIGLMFYYFEADMRKIIDAFENDTYFFETALFFGAAIPLINLILMLLANRGIKKDIELLKSVDRL